MAEDRSDNDSDESDFDAFPRFRAYPKIGKYQPTKILGQGGMGTVYLAEQTDPIVRKVAIKVINPGRDSKDFLQRFDAERRALALMDHEFIARILDADVTKTGQPYHVMEFVEGSSLVEFCDKSQLSIPERLNLFLDVCRGIEHAHQKAILHRDLKPANILVDATTQTPKPKIIDFGLVKALDNGTILARTDKTEMGQLLGSLEYMSPEQAALGEVDVDTRSDVYSLGVVLFELLTGTTPFRDTETRKTSLLDLLEQIRNGKETRTLSQAISESTVNIESLSKTRGLTSKRLRQLVSGDLEIIVSKATSSDRERRYKSISRFADDIKNYLENKPIEARKASKLYLAKRFCRRNMKSISAATAFVLLLVIATITSSYFAIRANIARKASEDSKSRAVKSLQQIQEFVLDSPIWKANEPSRTLLIDLLAERYTYLAEESNDPRKEIPELSIALTRLGDQKRIVAQYREALSICEKSERILHKYSDILEPIDFRICSAYALALKLNVSMQNGNIGLQSVAKENLENIISYTLFPTNDLWRNVRFGEVLFTRAFLHFDTGSELAYGKFSEGAKLLRDLSAKKPNEMDYLYLLAKFENMRAKSLHKGFSNAQDMGIFGGVDNIIKIYDSAEWTTKQLIDEGYKTSDSAHLLAEIKSNRGLRLLNHEYGKGLISPEEIVKNYQAGIEICEKQLQKYPANVGFLKMKGRLLLNMANAHVKFRAPIREEEYRLECRKILDEVIKTVPTQGEISIDHASNEVLYVQNLYLRGKTTKAYELVSSIFERGLPLPLRDQKPLLLFDSILLKQKLVTDVEKLKKIQRRREENFQLLMSSSDDITSLREFLLKTPEFEDLR